MLVTQCSAVFLYSGLQTGKPMWSTGRRSQRIHIFGITRMHCWLLLYGQHFTVVCTTMFCCMGNSVLLYAQQLPTVRTTRGKHTVDSHHFTLQQPQIGHIYGTLYNKRCVNTNLFAFEFPPIIFFLYLCKGNST